MSGGGKSQTVGWRYFFGIHAGIGHGPADAMHEIRVGDRQAWLGEVTENTTINIDAYNLFGGEEKEGGVQGSLDVMMGGPDQVASPGLVAMRGADLPGFRGKITTFFNGLIGMNNPYPKPWKYRINRILKGWDGPVFAPDLARIKVRDGGDGAGPLQAYMPLVSSIEGSTNILVNPGSQTYVFEEGSLTVKSPTTLEPSVNISNSFRTILSGGGFQEHIDLLRYSVVVRDFSHTPSEDHQLREIATLVRFVAEFQSDVPGGTRTSHCELRYGYLEGSFQFYLDCFSVVNSVIEYEITIPMGQTFENNSTVTLSTNRVTRRINFTINGATIHEFDFPSTVGINQNAYACTLGLVAYPLDSENPLLVPRSIVRWNDIRFYTIEGEFVAGDMYAMNGAHIIYECLTNRIWGRGLSASRLDVPSFMAAANTLFDESFGLCVKWTQEDSIENFVQMVINHIGAVIYTSRVTGLINLKLIREDYNVEDLPLYDEDSGILAVTEDTIGTVGKSVNTITVEWHDPFEDEKRTVSVRNPAAVMSNNGVVNPATKSYPGIPYSALALRVAQRDLRASSTALRRFTLVCDQRFDAMHAGDVFVFQDLKRGIYPTVVRVGKVKDGTITDGRMTLSVAEDVFGTPTVAFAADVPPVWTPPDNSACVPEQAVFEAPYFMMAARMSASDLDYVDPDSGYIAAVSAKGKATNAGVQIATRDDAPTPDDTPPDDSRICNI